jgi:hypothetical protein
VYIFTVLGTLSGASYSALRKLCIEDVEVLNLIVKVFGCWGVKFGCNISTHYNTNATRVVYSECYVTILIQGYFIPW